MKHGHNGEEIYAPNPSFDFHHPAHLSGALKDLITTFSQTFHIHSITYYASTTSQLDITLRERVWGWFSSKTSFTFLNVQHCDPSGWNRRLILMMAVGFVSRQQQVACRLMSPLSPTRLRIWRQDRETGEQADILDGTQKYTGKETRRAGGGTKAEENCHCYEELWVHCCHRYSMAFPLGECCWINALLWHSEAGEHSPKKINWEEVSGQLCRAVEEYFMGRENYMEGR